MDELLDSSEAGGLRDLQDYSKCELCRQRYRLPAAVLACVCGLKVW